MLRYVRIDPSRYKILALKGRIFDCCHICSSSSVPFTPRVISRSQTCHVCVLHTIHHISRLIILRIRIQYFGTGQRIYFDWMHHNSCPSRTSRLRNVSKHKAQRLLPSQLISIVIGPLPLHHFHKLSLNGTHFVYFVTYSSQSDAHYHPSRECLHSNSSHIRSPHDSSDFNFVIFLSPFTCLHKLEFYWRCMEPTLNECSIHSRS